MTHRLVIRGDWNAFGLYLEPADAAEPSRLVQVFNSLSGAARAAARMTQEADKNQHPHTGKD